MSGYWIDSPDNPFNRMDYTRGGGGRDNADTQESNDRRAAAMHGSGLGALPRFASAADYLSATHGGRTSGPAIVGDKIVHVAPPKNGGAAAKPPKTPNKTQPVAGQKPGGSGPGSSGTRTQTDQRGAQGGNGPGEPRAGSAGGSGAGSAVVVTGPLKPTMQDTITQFQVGGVTWYPEPNTSNADQVEERLGEAEFLSPAWFVNWGIAAVDTVYNVNKARNDLGTSMMSTLDQFGSGVAKEWDRVSKMPAIYEAEQRHNPFMVASPPY